MQRGFKVGDEVAANFSFVKIMNQVAKTNNNPLYIAFTGFKMAFNSVYHGAILEAVEVAGLDNSSIKYLKSMYTN